MANSEQHFSHKTIEDIINNKGFIVIYENDSEKRKKLHKFAKSKGYFHVSFVDITKKVEEELKYWCESVSRFLNEDECVLTTQYITEKNEQSFIYCSRCFEKDDLTDKDILIEEGYMYDEGYHTVKLVKKNNTVAISKSKEYLENILEQEKQEK